MGIRKDQLWVVPVFCIGAGIATHIVYFAAHFLVWIVSYPYDGWFNVYDHLVFVGCFQIGRASCSERVYRLV